MAPQVKGKSVYLQYSTRQEIVTTSRDGDSESNVLLVSIDDVGVSYIVTPSRLSITVAIPATLYDTALVQYDEQRTAEEAKSALDGATPSGALLDTSVHTNPKSCSRTPILDGHVAAVKPHRGKFAPPSEIPPLPRRIHPSQ
eukprot:1186655-Prorocentrum_minimum.AAC.1